MEDWVEAHMHFPGFDAVVAAWESHMSEGLRDEFEFSPYHITVGTTSWIITRTNEIIPCSTFSQTLPGWHLVQENMALNGSSWFHARPQEIETADAVFLVRGFNRIRPQHDCYYQRLAVLPSQWQVLDNLGDLADVVGSNALNRNPDGELYTDRGADLEWRGRNLSIQDFSTWDVQYYAWYFYSFPGFPQRFLVRGYDPDAELVTEQHTRAARRYETIQPLENYSDLLNLWPREYLRQNAQLMEAELRPQVLPHFDLTRKSRAGFKRQMKRGVVSWDLWKIRGTNFTYAIPARVTIVPATQFLEG